MLDASLLSAKKMACSFAASAALAMSLINEPDGGTQGMRKISPCLHRYRARASSTATVRVRDPLQPQLIASRFTGNGDASIGNECHVDGELALDLAGQYRDGLVHVV
jgi:hypothetical protein